MELTRLAPIASRQSTCTWTTRLSWPRSRTSIVARAAAALHQVRTPLACPSSRSSARGGFDARHRSGRVRHVVELHLRRSSAPRPSPPEAAARAHHLRGVGSRGDHARLLHRPWAPGGRAPLMRKLSATPKGRPYMPSTFSTMLSAVIRRGRPVPSAASSSCRVDAGSRADLASTLLRAQLVEAGDARARGVLGGDRIASGHDGSSWFDFNLGSGRRGHPALPDSLRCVRDRAARGAGERRPSVGAGPTNSATSPPPAPEGSTTASSRTAALSRARPPAPVTMGAPAASPSRDKPSQLRVEGS